MMEGLAPIDGWALAAILAKSLGYGAALLAIGGPLFVVAFRTAPDDALRLVRNIAVLAALISVAILAVQFGIRSARISGMGLAGATDLMMLGFVWDSPLGTAAIWRCAGLILVLAILIEGAVGIGASLIGVLLIAASFTQIGHALGNPRWILASLLTVHLLVAAFWIAALAPLWRIVEHRGGAILLHRFGKIASITVTVLVIVGVAFAWMMVGSITALFTTAYGWGLLGKITCVSGLMSLAAYNKWRLVPALEMGDAMAVPRLKRSIRMEVVATILILIATATLTSITTPPVNL